MPDPMGNINNFYNPQKEKAQREKDKLKLEEAKKMLEFKQIKGGQVQVFQQYDEDK